MINLKTTWNEHVSYLGEPGAYRLILGNKADLDDDLRENTFEEGQEAAKNLKADFREISIKNSKIEELK